MYHIQVFGLGCVRCANLAQRAESAAQELGILYRLEKVNTLDRILEMEVAVPALVVNGQLLASGIVPSAAEIQELLRGIVEIQASSLAPR